MTGKEVPIRARAVSIHLVREDAFGPEVLLLRRAGTLAGTWCQVAGRIEEGETAWQAALREVREETGLAPNRLYNADILEQFYVAARNIIAILPVFVGYVGEEAEVALNDEHDAHVWLSFEDARERVSFAGQRRVLEHIEQEFFVRRPNEWLRIPIPEENART